MCFKTGLNSKDFIIIIIAWLDWNLNDCVVATKT